MFGEFHSGISTSSVACNSTGPLVGQLLLFFFGLGALFLMFLLLLSQKIASLRCKSNKTKKSTLFNEGST